MRNPLLFLAACVVLHAALSSLVRGTPGTFIRDALMGLVFPCITAAILFFIVTRFFKASGTYEMAFRIQAYAGAVSLLSWFPLLPAVLVLEIYRLYLITLGLTAFFALKTSRAFLAILLTMAVLVVASGALSHLSGGSWFR